MNLARSRFREWGLRNPGYAAAYAGLAGSSLLLMPFTFRTVADIRRSLAGPLGSSDELSAATEEVAEDSQLLEAGATSFAAMDVDH
jgi:hypothetical protein